MLTLLRRGPLSPQLGRDERGQTGEEQRGQAAKGTPRPRPHAGGAVHLHGVAWPQHPSAQRGRERP